MRTIAVAAAVVFAAAAFVPAAALPKSPKMAAATTGVVAELTGCRTLTDDAARLTCYDKAAAKLEAATAAGDVKVLDREDIRATRRSLFGFELPKLPFFKGDDSAKDTPEAVDTVVKSVQPATYGKFTLTMEDGSVWQSTEPLPRDPKVGAKVHLKTGALGNFFMTVGSMRSVRAMRIR